MANYLVTGTAGFIGSRVARILLDEGHFVAGLDNLNSSYDVRLKEWRLESLRPRDNFRFELTDICDRFALEALVDELPPLDAIINLAARAGVRQSLEDPWAYFETNNTGTLNLLDLCVRRGIEKFVQASTSSVYGDQPKQPLHEELPTSRVLSPYAASKKAAEVLCHSYHHLHDLDITILRFFTVYGPAGRPDMSLMRFVRWISEGETVRIFGDGHQSRDFTNIRDIGRGTVAALRKLGFSIINLGSDEPTSLLELISFIEEAVGRKAEMKHEPSHPSDVRKTWADISKAADLLGWQPEVDLRTGVQELVRWYRANRQRALAIEL